MRRLTKPRMYKIALTALLSGLLLSGCGGRMELGERGFVLGVAVDLNDGMIELTSQIYKPAGGDTEQQGGSIVNIHTQGRTLFEAVREITLKLGRRAQWSHMQSLLIGQELAESDMFRHSIDFFYRDHEPRLTTPVLIAKGKASRLLDKKPMIETSISRQFREAQRIGIASSGKAIETNLLTLNKEMKKETSTIVISVVHESNDRENNPVIQGGALINKGKMIGIIGPEDVQSYLMLTNGYKSGVVAIGCKDSDMKRDSIEIVTLESRIIPKSFDDEIRIAIEINITASIGELNCASLREKEEMSKYEQHVADALDAQLRQSIAKFKEWKADLVGIGDHIHRKDARSWYRLKRDWERRLSEIVYDLDIKVNITSTGLEIDQPIFHD